MFLPYHQIYCKKTKKDILVYTEEEKNATATIPARSSTSVTGLKKNHPLPPPRIAILETGLVSVIRILNSDPSSSSSASFSSIATAAYSESDSDSSWDKFVGAFLNSLVFVAAITVATFVLVLLFYLRCVRFLKFYMGFSSFIVLANLGGEILVLLIDRFRFPIDSITFSILLFNFYVVGVFAVFMSRFSILITQGYLVVIGVLVAYFFTLLPEWTTWVLLVALALYDVAAVLLPVGPLRLLVEMAISRDEDIPALVYEARPVIRNESSVVQRRVWRGRRYPLRFNTCKGCGLGDIMFESLVSC